MNTKKKMQAICEQANGTIDNIQQMIYGFEEAMEECEERTDFALLKDTLSEAILDLEFQRGCLMILKEITKSDMKENADE